MKPRLGVVGLGYVGLPVAVAFGLGGYDVVGFDINVSRVDALQRAIDHTGEESTARLIDSGVVFSSDPQSLQNCTVFIVTVPTPIDTSKAPDLGALRAASVTLAPYLKQGDVVVYESTVYPGCTEEICLPLLEQGSGLSAPDDFCVGYSPERINPGDPNNRFETISKIVSAQTPEVCEQLSALYGSVISAPIHQAPSIKVAEAAKVIENTQRDLNIALINELSLIFRKLDIDTADVLHAAGTKWNFLPFRPGLVGGHCIGVDPYYLTHKASAVGHTAEVILAGRRVNDTMGQHIAQECVRLLLSLQNPNRTGAALRVHVLGLTFKENIPDIRNTKVVDVLTELERFGIVTSVSDPFAAPDEVLQHYGRTLSAPEASFGEVDAVVFAVPHGVYVQQGWQLVTDLLGSRGSVVMDVKGILARQDKPDDLLLWRL